MSNLSAEPNTKRFYPLLTFARVFNLSKKATRIITPILICCITAPPFTDNEAKIVQQLRFLCKTATSFHSLYLSVAKLDVLTEKKVELAIKCFGNGLEDALRKINHTGTDLNSPHEKQKNEKLLRSYFESRFETRINSKKIDFDFLGFEKDEDVTWTYFEALCRIRNRDSLIIGNTVLCEFLPQQTNIVHIKRKGRS